MGAIQEICKCSLRTSLWFFRKSKQKAHHFLLPCGTGNGLPRSRLWCSPCGPYSLCWLMQASACMCRTHFRINSQVFHVQRPTWKIVTRNLGPLQRLPPSDRIAWFGVMKLQNKSSLLGKLNIYLESRVFKKPKRMISFRLDLHFISSRIGFLKYIAVGQNQEPPMTEKSFLHCCSPTKFDRYTYCRI